MAPSFHPTTATRFHLGAADPHMSFLPDDPDVAHALLGFVCDPANARLDDFLSPGPHELHGGEHRGKRLRAASCDDGAWLDGGQPWNYGGAAQQAPLLPEFHTEFVLPLPQMPPPAFAKPHKACGPSVQSSAARERRRRISEKTAELSRLVPGGHKLNTAEMLHEAGRHVKLLQAQVGMLALMRTVEEKSKMPAAMAGEQMHALLVCGGVQERLAAEGRCLVPRKLVDAMGKDSAIKSNALVKRELTRFIESLEQQ